MQTDKQSVEPEQSELPQTELQPTQALAPAPHRRPRLWFFRAALLGLMGAVLLAVGMIAVRTLNPLLPKLTKGPRSVSARLAFYVQHDQWKADLHTLASAVEYAARSSRSPDAMPSATVPVVLAPRPSTPNS